LAPPAGAALAARRAAWFLRLGYAAAVGGETTGGGMTGHARRKTVRIFMLGFKIAFWPVIFLWRAARLLAAFVWALLMMLLLALLS
jgi:hypothetical protein